jgi:hypothetical protein
MVIIMGILDLLGAFLLAFYLSGAKGLPWGLVLTVIILMFLKGITSFIRLT